jgi:hypothetical protein
MSRSRATTERQRQLLGLALLVSLGHDREGYRYPVEMC